MAEHGVETSNVFGISMDWKEEALKLIPFIIWFIKAYIIPWLKRKRLATLHGQVSDEPTGVPIEGILITCKGSKGLYTTITSGDGSYRLEHLTPGSYTVMFTDPQGRYQPKVV